MSQSLVLRGTALVGHNGKARIDLEFSAADGDAGALVSKRKPPTGKGVRLDMEAGLYKVHASKVQASASDIGAQLCTIQKDLHLATGRTGGWNDEAQRRLEAWLSSQKKQRTGLKAAAPSTAAPSKKALLDKGGVKAEKGDEDDDSDAHDSSSTTSSSGRTDKEDGDDSHDNPWKLQCEALQRRAEDLEADLYATDQELQEELACNARLVHEVNRLKALLAKKVG